MFFKTFWTPVIVNSWIWGLLFVACGASRLLGGYFTVSVSVSGFRTDALCLRVVYRGSSMFLGCSWWCIMSLGVFLSCICDTLHCRTLTRAASWFLVFALRLGVGYHDFLYLLCGYFGVFKSLFSGARVTFEVFWFHAPTVVLLCYLAIAYWPFAGVSRNYDILRLFPCFLGALLFFCVCFAIISEICGLLVCMWYCDH